MRRVAFLLAAIGLLRADPPGMVFATYLGGGGAEVVGSVATDAGGNIYIAGRTDSPDFPLRNPIQSVSHAFSQLFITKFSPSGDLIYSTYLGGSANDAAVAIATDPAGNVYVTGNLQSVDFPVSNAFQPSSGGGVDAFVLKLDPNGNVLYSTYLGGKQNDLGMAITADAQGNAYVTGRTESRDFPITPGAFQAKAGTSVPDAFVTKLDPSGKLVYSTFLGGSDGDIAWGIAVDASGQAHIAGETTSLDFPVTPDAFQPWSGRAISLGVTSSDAFLTKLSADGSSLIYSTYLGGPGTDTARAIRLDANGNAFITGTTSDARLPILGGQQQYLGGDVYLLSSDGGASFTTRRTGLATSYVGPIVFDPAAPPRVYAGTAQGVLRSDDGGANWTPAGLDQFTIDQLAIDPTNGALYAGTDYGGGLFRSTDQGASWKSLNSGLPGITGTALESIAVDPSGSGTVYVYAGFHGTGAGFDQPLFRVTDDGATWTPIGKGLPSTPEALLVNPADASVFAGTTAFSFFSFGGSGLNIPGTVYHRLNDDWQQSTINDDIHALAASSTTVYAAGRQFFKSADGGQTWSSTPLPGDGLVQQLAIDPRNPSTIYALRVNNDSHVSPQLLRSDDGGDTWQGSDASNLNSMAVSPSDSTLHAGTSASADAFIAEFDPSGALVYSTFLGGPAAERGDGIAVDSSGAVYLIGFLADNVGPVSTSFAITYDGVSYLARAGDGGYSMPIGRTTSATVLSIPSRGIAIAPDGGIITVMMAAADGLPVQNAVQQNLHGISDAYLVKLMPDMLMMPPMVTPGTGPALRRSSK